MAQTIKLKRSATSGAVPTTASLALGEVAINTHDGKVYIKKDDGAESVIEVGDTSGYLPLSGGTLTGDIALGDNDKATFGASDDLQIYHDGNDSYIDDAGQGSLAIRGSASVSLQNYAGGVMLKGNAGSDTVLYHNNLDKLATTSTGIDVTGRAVVDGLTSSASIVGTSNSNSLGGTTFTSAISTVGLSSTAAISSTSNSNSLGGTNFTSNINVTGTATMDGLTVSGSGTSAIVNISNGIDNTPNRQLAISETGGSGFIYQLDSTGASGLFGQLAFATNGTERIRIGSGGDVSFYEDTGTTPKFFWDASAESLGIGTSSPANEIHIKTSVPFVKLESTDTGYNGFNAKNDSGNFYFGIDGSGGNFYGSAYARAIYSDGDYPVTFYTNATEAMRIDSSGNVGVGNSNPQNKLDIEQSAAVSARLLATGATSSSLKLEVKGGATQLTTTEILANSSGSLTFATGTTSGTERMRIDSSGNLLVGVTSLTGADGPRDTSTTAGLGVGLNYYGGVYAAAYQASPFVSNRISTDGELFTFKKDGTTVGSIGTLNRLTIGNAATGLSFNSSTVAVQPHNMTTNAATDNTIDLGVSGARFKDLYLSGNINTSTVTVTDGVYIGGNGFANKLDDYEEGTFTPAITFGGAAVDLTYTSARGRYTKVGRLVTVQIGIDINSKGTSTGNMAVTGLPFGSATFTGGYGGHIGAMRVDGGWTGLTGATVPYINEGGATTIEIRQGTSAGTNPVTDANTTSGYFFITSTYTTA